ncbi:MAG: glycosyltransferase family 39 protein [Candidatus Kerfeldbacteria bacterium]
MTWIPLALSVAVFVAWIFLPPESPAYSYLDPFLIGLFFFESLLLNRTFSAHGLYHERRWFAAVIILWLFSIIAALAEIHNPKLYNFQFPFYIALLAVMSYQVRESFIQSLRTIDDALRKWTLFENSRARDIATSSEQRQRVKLHLPMLSRLKPVSDLLCWKDSVGWPHVLILLGLIGIFISYQVFSIYSTGIGTDEGNTLYVIKMLNEGLVMYKDFWYREPLAIYMYYPVSFLFSDPLLGLRLFVVAMQFLILTVSYAFIRRLFSSQAALATVLILVLFSGVFMRSTWGLFNIVWFPFVIGMTAYGIELLTLPRTRLRQWAVIGLLIGSSILIYKASQAFLVFLIVVFVLQHKRISKELVTAYVVSFLPIALFWLVFGMQSTFEHVYVLVLKKVIWLYAGLGASLAAGWLGLLAIRRIKTLIRWLDANLFVAANAASIALFFVIVFGSFLSSGEINKFWPLLMESLFVFISISLLNYIYLLKRSALLGYGVLFLFIAFYFIVFAVQFGSSGFFRDVHPFLHVSIAGCIIVSIILAILIARDIRDAAIDRKTEIILFSTNTFLLGMMYGAVFMPSRFKYILYLFPLVLFAVVQSTRTFRKAIRYSVFGIIVVSLFIANFVSNFYPTDYTLYTYKNLQRVVDSIELEPDDTFFTGDYVLASMITNENLLKVGTPWIYRIDLRRPAFWDDRLDTFGGYIQYGAVDYAQLIRKKKPKFIMGSARMTFRTFFQSKKNGQNAELESILEADYSLIQNIGKVKIYIHNDYLSRQNGS